MRTPEDAPLAPSANATESRAELEIEAHATAARRRAGIALVAVVLGIALVIWASVNVRRIDARATEAGADTSITVLSGSTAPYLIALALGLIAAFGGVLVASLSWMYVRHLNQAREKLPRVHGG